MKRVAKSNASSNLLRMCAGDTPMYDGRVARMVTIKSNGIITKDGETIKDLKKYMKEKE